MALQTMALGLRSFRTTPAALAPLKATHFAYFSTNGVAPVQQASEQAVGSSEVDKASQATSIAAYCVPPRTPHLAPGSTPGIPFSLSHSRSMGAAALDHAKAAEAKAEGDDEYQYERIPPPPYPSHDQMVRTGGFMILFMDIVLKIWVGFHFSTIFPQWGLPFGLVLAGILTVVAHASTKNFAVLRFLGTRFGYEHLVNRGVAEAVLDFGRISYATLDHGLFRIDFIKSHQPVKQKPY